MTDNEIVKALECCILGDCQGCFYGDTDQRHCKDDLMQNALDLINRLQAEKQDLEIELKAMRGAANSYKAEIERLEANLNIELENFATEYDNKIKAEAYKEFAERVKLEFYYQFDELIPSIMADKIDNLLKELVGEDQ